MSLLLGFLSVFQDEHQRSETKLQTTTNELNEASDRTDKINRAIKTLETKNMIDEERIDLLENQVGIWVPKGSP